jgi:hypothetical protein
MPGLQSGRIGQHVALRPPLSVSTGPHVLRNSRNRGGRSCRRRAPSSRRHDRGTRQTCELAAIMRATPGEARLAGTSLRRGRVPNINQLTGRPNGYVAASVLVDSRVECATAEPGVDCGATVEQWPDEGAAHKRADYIQETLASMPMLGTEWTTVKGKSAAARYGQTKAFRRQGLRSVLRRLRPGPSYAGQKAYLVAT